MKLKSVLTKIGVGLGLSMVVTLSHAALECKDIERSNYDAPENMQTLAVEARLIDGYASRHHETIVWKLCGYHEEDENTEKYVEKMIDEGYVRRSEVEGIKEVLGIDKRSPAGRNYEYSYIKLINDIELSSAGASHAASFYAYKPNSECGKLAKRALAGDRIAIKKLETEDSICTSGYEN